MPWDGGVRDLTTEGTEDTETIWGKGIFDFGFLIAG